jgi:hypothetical protein
VEAVSICGQWFPKSGEGMKEYLGFLAAQLSEGDLSGGPNLIAR